MAAEYVFDRYIDRNGKWRWRFVYTGNGKIMADSGQGYSSLAACDEAIAVIKREAPLARLV
jgi:uncharacterized protein YegP (UPF0339 family)